MDALFTNHRILVNRKENKASIYLSLETGVRFFFGKTTFEGDFISHGLLERMMPYKEGDPFSTRALVQLRQSFYNSEYFESVEVEAGEVASGKTSVPVRVVIEPKNPNKYAMGVGYGTDTGIRGTIEWTNRRLNRYGHQLRIALQPSERKSLLGGVYSIPIKDPRKDRLSLLAKWEKENFENTETEKRSTTISYDHIREAGEYSLYFNFLDENFDTGIETGHSSLFMPGMKTTLRIADDRLVTKRGLRTTLNLTGSHESLLSDASFFQAFLASKGIWSFFETWRGIGRFQLGWTVIDDFEDIPPSLRFYAGGDESVRGYRYKSIAPQDSKGDVLGGQYLLTYSLELEKRFSEDWSGAVFFDSGEAFDSWTDLAMKNGAGFGIRWNAPFGQVRLDIANALSDGGGSWRIHFNIGADL